MRLSSSGLIQWGWPFADREVFHIKSDPRQAQMDRSATNGDAGAYRVDGVLSLASPVGVRAGLGVPKVTELAHPSKGLIIQVEVDFDLCEDFLFCTAWLDWIGPSSTPL